MGIAMLIGAGLKYEPECHPPIHARNKEKAGRALQEAADRLDQLAQLFDVLPDADTVLNGLGGEVYTLIATAEAAVVRFRESRDCEGEA